MKKTIITISREFGSGGRTIGHQVADRLGYPYYDKELIKTVAEKTGFDPNYVEEYGEYSPGKSLLSLLSSYTGAHGTMGGIQWGLRYTIDAIPAAALGIALLRRPEGEGLDAVLPPALVFGLCLNLVGTLAILNDWNIFL